MLAERQDSKDQITNELNILLFQILNKHITALEFMLSTLDNELSTENILLKGVFQHGESL